MKKIKTNNQGPIITFFFFSKGDAKIKIICKDAGDFELNDYLLLLQSFNDAYEICEAVVENQKGNIANYKSLNHLVVKKISKESPLIMELLSYLPEAVKLLGDVCKIIDFALDDGECMKEIRAFPFLKNISDEEFDLFYTKAKKFTKIAKAGKIIVEVIQVITNNGQK